MGLAVERQLPGLERRLKVELPGSVDFSRFTRGRYATDASHYQIMPLGVVTPRTIEEAERAIGICRAEGVPVTPRGGGTSQAGQTVNSSLIVDCSKHLDRILDLDVAGARAAWSSPASCSTNSTARSNRTGFGFRSTSRPPRAPPSEAWRRTTPAAHARSATATPARMSSPIDALLADGAQGAFRAGGGRPFRHAGEFGAASAGARSVCARRARGRTRSRRAFPRCSAGSAATISTRSRRDETTSTSRISWSAPKARWRSPPRSRSKSSPVLGRRAVGACHFGGFHEAMAAAQHIVKLGAHRSRAGRPHDDRTRPRHRHVPADAGSVRAR